MLVITLISDRDNTAGDVHDDDQDDGTLLRFPRALAAHDSVCVVVVLGRETIHATYCPVQRCECCMFP